MHTSRIAAIVVAALALALPASASAAARILPGQAGLKDLDARTGRVLPTAAQKQEVSALSARAQWNRYGTPASLIADDGYLSGVGSGSAPEVARSFIRSHADLFRLSAADVDNLELVNDAKLVASDGHAVLFRQRFGSLAAGHDGMITVGVSGGRVAYVSSSAVGSQAAPAAATLSATDAWLKAANNAGFNVTRSALKTPATRDGWTTFDVSGLATPLAGKHAVGQRARLVAFPTYTQGVRAAFETVVLDVQGGRSRAYRSFVDARTGDVLFRSNEVKELADDQPSGGTFTGNTGSGCGDPTPIDVAGAFSVSAVASANLPSDDIVLKLIGPGGSAVASSDTGTSPEAVNYTGYGG
jgi:extracellular elastinolytic metalloproteinase